jgi:hypothetical protein
MEGKGRTGNNNYYLIKIEYFPKKRTFPTLCRINIKLSKNIKDHKKGSGLAVQQKICYIHAMTRPLRIEFKGAVYHITSVGNTRQSIFLTEEDFADFFKVLCFMVKRYHFLLPAYCLISNHYHLFIEIPIEY